MDYSIVENNVVINVVVADSPLAPNWYEGNHGIGAIFDPEVGTFTLPSLPDPVPGTPQSVTMRQARLALLQAGLLSTINAGISAMPEDVQIEWEFAATVDRASPLVATLAAALSLDEVALDQLFVVAALI